MVGFIIFCFVCASIWYFFRVRKKKKLKKSDRIEPKFTISISSTPSGSFENPDTGSVTYAQSNGWTLNPKSTFPLTIYGIDKPVAEELKRILDSGYSLGTYTIARKLIPVLARSNLRCKEIDEYIEEFKPKYLSKIEQLKQLFPEWTSSSAKDKEDLMVGFRQQAIESLDVKPYCDLETLFECEPADLTIDDALTDQFGYENIQVYLRHAGNLDKVHVIPAGHYERGIFEKLVELGLATRGADISLQSILASLTLKQMNDLASDLNQIPFKRKTKAIEFLINLPDIQKRVGKIVAFRELFQLKPLPGRFSQIDLNKVSEAWGYASEITTLITHTYMMGGYAARNRSQYQSSSSFATGWELTTASDNATCPYCVRAATKTYSKIEYPRTPLHIGCRCSVLPKLSV